MVHGPAFQRQTQQDAEADDKQYEKPGYPQKMNQYDDKSTKVIEETKPDQLQEIIMKQKLYQQMMEQKQL